MELKDLSQYVPTQYILYTVLVMLALTILIIKYYPKFKSWFDTARTKVNAKEDLIKSVRKNSDDIEDIRKEILLINDKIGRDYARLNQIQNITIKQQKYIEDSLEERELIIKSLLGVVQGLQEVGANGPTKRAEAEIQAYLLKKSHEAPDNNEETIKED